MCFFSRQSKKAVEIEHRFNAKIENPHAFESSNYINGFEFPKTPVIINTDTSVIKHFRWGLIPSWAKDDSIKKYTLNAKIESLNKKPSFRNSLNKRCLVVVDGFYEWQWLDPKGKSKQQYLITLPNDELFSFGGIWSEWTNKQTGEVINTYSIVTTEANDMMSRIHNSKKRMPLILTERNEKDWLQKRPIENFRQIDTALKAIQINM